MAIIIRQSDMGVSDFIPTFTCYESNWAPFWQWKKKAFFGQIQFEGLKMYVEDRTRTSSSFQSFSNSNFQLKNK